jgi:hypothetical protein
MNKSKIKALHITGSGGPFGLWDQPHFTPSKIPGTAFINTLLHFYHIIASL